MHALRFSVGLPVGLLFLAAAAAAAQEPAAADRYAGLKTVAVQTEHLRLVVCPQVGGRITELVSRKTGVSRVLMDPREFARYRELDIGEGFLLMAGGVFDVVSPEGARGYPGWFQCAPYEVAVDDKAAAPSIAATCTRGSIAITRKMTLAADAPRLTVEVTYRNVSKRPLWTAIALRTDLMGELGRHAPRVILPVEGKRLGIYDRCEGLGRVVPGGGWILHAPDRGEMLLWRFNHEQIAFVRGFAANAYAEAMHAITLEQRSRRLEPGMTTTLQVQFTVLPEGAKEADEKGGMSLVLDILPALRTHATGLSAFGPIGALSLPQVVYARKRPWAGDATEYAAGDDIVLRSTFTPFLKAGKQAPALRVRIQGRLALPDDRALEAEASIGAAGSTDLVFPAKGVGSWAGPFACSYALQAPDGFSDRGVLQIRYHNRADPRIPRLIRDVRRRIGALDDRRDEPDVATALPWIEKRLEYAECLYKTGDYRYRPFCHGQAREEAYGSSSEALALLADAAESAGQLEQAGRSPRQWFRPLPPIAPGGHVFCYDLAPYGAKIVPIVGDEFALKLVKFEQQVDKLEANPAAAKDIGWYRALCLLGRRAVEDGVRADDGDAAAATLAMVKWLDDCAARLAKWPEDGWKQGKFRFPYEGLIDFYTKHLERYRGYSVYVPGRYDGKTALPVLVDPNSYGNLMPCWAVPADPDPVTRDGAVEAYGYFQIFPGHTNTYSRSGNPEDVRRVLADAAKFLKLDADRFYCTGGSLNADATGNLANSMAGTWAAVAPFSQGAQLWTLKTAPLPRVNFQAGGGEAAVFTKGIKLYRDAGVYDPRIHLGGLYPGVGHCGMSRDMWQFVFEFFARHQRPPAAESRPAEE